MKQASFLPSLKLDHGGDLRKGKRKIARPFSHKHAVHLVLRSVKARGHWSLLTRANEHLVEKLLKACAAQYHIKVYRFVNVGNHLHLLIKTEAKQYVSAKRDFHAFLRQFAGAVAFQITGAKKASPKGGFWEKLAYSRIVSWGREYQGMKDYFTKNFLESKGLWWGKGDSWLRPILVSLRKAGVGPPS